MTLDQEEKWLELYVELQKMQADPAFAPYASRIAQCLAMVFSRLFPSG